VVRTLSLILISPLFLFFGIGTAYAVVFHCVLITTVWQIIWDEIGESDDESDRMLLQLEQECLDIYRRKVDRTRKYKAELHQSLAESEAEITNLISALGERTIVARVLTLTFSIFNIRNLGSGD